MELNMNINRLRAQSLDEDDNFSAHSRNSLGFFSSLNSANNSDSECSGPTSVRDMIQRYNKQFQKTQTNQGNYKIKQRFTPARRQHSQHQLAATKSSFCGLNNYGSQINGKQFNDQLHEDKSMTLLVDHEQHQIICCKNCTACLCCQNRSLKNSIANQMLSTSETTPLLLQTNNQNNQNPNSLLNFHSNASGDVCNTSNNCCNQINAKTILAVENYTKNDETVDTNKPNIVTNTGEVEELQKKDSVIGLYKNHLQQRSSQLFGEQKSNHLLSSTDSVEEAKQLQQQQQQPKETCYQSKTTIAKTSSGVRIIIDIFFDQEQCNINHNASDIVGSRVETDIPQSRILSEFQQQTMAKHNSNTAVTSTSIAATTQNKGCMSEEAIEANHENVRRVRLSHTRKPAREDTNRDLMTYMLLQSDPVLSSKRNIKKKTFDLAGIEKYIHRENIDFEDYIIEQDDLGSSLSEN